MSATIRDVAQLAGVSASTVSRALGWPHLVSPATRERVHDAVSTVGYVPNRAARGLITGRTGNFAVLVPDLTNPFFPGVVKGVQLQANHADYSVFIADTEDAQAEAHLAHDLAQQVDGIVLCSSQLSEAALAELRERTAVVLLNRAVDGIPSVTFDNADGIRQAITHLRALGHQHVAWIGGPATSWSARMRRDAVHREAEASGLELSDLGAFPARFEGGVSAGDLVLSSGATSVIAYNDVIALGAISRMAARGARVPSDVSVVGIDGSLMGEISSPSLTSVALPQERAGRECVSVLLGILGQGGGAQESWRAMPVELLVRGSTGVARG
jgi:LacI family transcriptional regulator